MAAPLTFGTAFATAGFTVDPNFSPNNQQFASAVFAVAARLPLPFAATPAELAANIPIVDFTYPPGWILRYGKNVIPGTTDMQPALVNAIASGSYVRIAPGGNYLFNSQTNVNKSGITIEGDNHLGVNCILGSAAGAGAAFLAWTGVSTQYQALVVKKLGITLSNAGLAQIGVRISQVLGARLRDLTIQGQGTTSDDTTGILLDGLLGPDQYSGDFSVEDCQINNHLIGVSVQGVSTTVRILNNEMNGSAGHATSTAFLIGNGGNTNNGNGAEIIVAPVVRGNTIVQWHTGIQSWGQQLRQAHNYFEFCDTTKMGGNYTITGITQAASAVITISTVSTNHPLATSNFAISGISKAASAVVTLSTVSAVNPVSVGCRLNFASVGGMTQINGLSGLVTAIGGVSGAWTATVGINSSGFTTYTSGGTAGTGAVGNAVNPTGINGMTQMNGLQGVISAIGGTSGAWTVTLGGANGYGAINSTTFSAYTSGGLLGTAQNFNWVRGVGVSNIQNSSLFDWFSTGTQNFPQNTGDLCTFEGPNTIFSEAAATFGSLAVTGNLTGPITIPTPTSGTALTVGDTTNAITNAVIGALTIAVGKEFNSNAAEIFPTVGTTVLDLGTFGAAEVRLWSNDLQRLTIASTGGVTIAKPTSGTAFTVGDTTTAITNAVIGALTIAVGQEFNSNSAEIFPTSGTTLLNIGTFGLAALGLWTNDVLRLNITSGGVVQIPTTPASATTTCALTGVAAYKPSDTTSASSTLTADATLTLTFNEAGKYAFEIWLPFYEASVGTGGFQFDLNSGTATVGAIVYGVDGFSTAAVINSGVTSVSTAVSAGSVATSSSAPSWFLAKGWFSITGGGTVAVRWAQASTLAIDPTTLKAGAYFMATKIG